MIIHFNLHASESFPIKLYAKPKQNREVKIKITNGTSPVIVKILSHDSFSCEQQEEHGHPFFADQYLTFELHIEDIQNFLAKVDIYVLEECIGTSIVTPHYLTNVFGTFVVSLLNPVTSKLSADIKFEYLLIRKWRDQKLTILPCIRTLSTTKEDFVYIGHRGNGQTIDRRSAVLENTIPSFIAAQSKGASHIELDVLLTKDEIPIVFHDYNASVHYERKDGSAGLLQVCVHDLTLDDLKSCKMDFARANGGDYYNPEVYNTLFPTLQEVLNETPSSPGICIEVKYPAQTRESKVWETKGYFDQNTVVDKILDVVMNYSEERPIIFGSFDPEICILLQYKQHRFPVVFITCGENSTWEAYMDIRNRTRKFALNFVLMNDLLGMSFYGDPVLQDTDEFSLIVSTLKRNQKHAFTFGPCNDQRRNVEYQKSLHLTGISSNHLENLSSNNL